MAKLIKDDIDQKLIALLKANAREPVASLSRKVGLSRSALQERIHRLERDGVISGYTVVLGTDPFQAYVSAHVLIRVRPRRGVEVVGILKSFSEISACQAISGEFDLLVTVRAPNLEGIDKILDDIRLIDGVENTQSSIVLSTKFRRG